MICEYDQPSGQPLFLKRPTPPGPARLGDNHVLRQHCRHEFAIVNLGLRLLDARSAGTWKAVSRVIAGCCNSGTGCASEYFAHIAKLITHLFLVFLIYAEAVNQ